MCVYKQKKPFIVYLVLGSTISTDTTLKVTTTAPTTVTTKSTTTTTTTEKAFTATKTTVDMDSSKIQTSVNGDKGIHVHSQIRPRNLTQPVILDVK